ncbi:MAG: hypothetical protein KC776_36220 [Myxococcales bacterium]|nr:hypothetical protein [Myxococcales bacterium]MCB9583116.1 hypothetical protein [Polyangiaceae bacterium]
MNNAAAERAALRVLGSPHTWCSGQCLECPLSESCVSTRRSMQLSMLEESLSQPNGEAYFKKVWALLDRLCDQELTPPAEEHWRPRAGRHFAKAADNLSTASEMLWIEDVLSTEDRVLEQIADGCMELANATLFHADRLATTTPNVRTPVGPLVYLRQLTRACDAAIELAGEGDRRIGRVLAAYSYLYDLLQPLFEIIPASADRALSTLVDADKAPVPFAQAKPKRGRG